MKDSYILESRIVTEKSTHVQGKHNEYTFRVNLKASKGAIAQEVAKHFKVEIADIKTLVMPGKKRRLGKTAGFRTTKRWKKAVVKLKEGQKIKED